MRSIMLAAGAVTALALSIGGPLTAHAREATAPRAQGWLVSAYGQVEVPPPAPDVKAELTELKRIMAKRTPEDIARFQWWRPEAPCIAGTSLRSRRCSTASSPCRWSIRHLALIHAAMDDAVAVAWHHRASSKRPRPFAADPSIKAQAPAPTGPAFPSDHAAAATAAAAVLGYIFPARASIFTAKAEEAIQSRLLAGVEYPSDVEAGRAIGKRIAALAIARGQSDRSDAKWTGEVPQGPGNWKGTNPIAPMAATWQPWVLARVDELRPAAPPAFDSEQTKAALAELKTFARTPKTNHRAVYWEVFGGARVHGLWNEIARLKLLEHGETFNAPTTSRALAALNIAFADAAIACWDAKYTYWYVRPAQNDADLKPLFPAPNHPSYPAAHGCLSTAAATALAGIFPRDRDRLLAHGKEAAEARVWAGIHYRFDIDVGQEIGRKVAEKTLQRAFVPTGL